MTGVGHSRVFEVQMAIITGEVRRRAMWQIYGKENRHLVLAAMRNILGLKPDEDIPLKNGKWDNVFENSVKKSIYEALPAPERKSYESTQRGILMKDVDRYVPNSHPNISDGRF